MPESIIKVLDLDCTPLRAFDIFVHRMSAWWPLDSHAVSVAGGQAAPGVAVEAWVGGRVVEALADGGSSVWGNVLICDPPHRFAMSWHPGTDPARPTRVDVAFDARPGGGTRVTLTHGGWDVWAADAPEKRGNYVTGWDFVFGTRFAAACGRQDLS
jgi:hypothetical protein